MMMEGQYNPYNMKNNSSLMLDQTTQDCGVRKSLMDLPRKLNDYQRSKHLVSNKGEKNDSVIVDQIGCVPGTSI